MIKDNEKVGLMMIFKITTNIYLSETDIEFSFIRSPGPGGQHVNKVATAVQLRFDALHSPVLPEKVLQRLRVLAGTKMTLKGEIVIKASRFRTQERNKEDALERLLDLLRRAAIIPKKRKPTKPTFAAKQKRLTQKKLQGYIKKLRGNKPESD